MENASLSDALISLIPTYGPWIIFGIVALESAGVPLPGETLLVAAALLATTGQISIVVVVLASAAGAIVGDGIGYMVERRFGLPLIRRYGRYIRLDENRLLIGRYLFFRYGNVVVFFGRFVAVPRMFAALLAGANSMPTGRFFFFNITGGVCWACLFGFGAYAVAGMTSFECPCCALRKIFPLGAKQSREHGGEASDIRFLSDLCPDLFGAHSEGIEQLSY